MASNACVFPDELVLMDGADVDPNAANGDRVVHWPTWSHVRERQY